MININKNSKIKIHWNVSPYDYNESKKKDLIDAMSAKYHIPKDRISVEANLCVLNEKGETVNVNNELISNIQDPQFQLKLFHEYLNVNKIENYDFDFIKKIDAEVNAMIDYDCYDKMRKYTIKWIKWSNFLSYGTDNYFDFTKLTDLVLLNGEPANQSGKTTFAIDLLHFLLFGKTSKASVQEKIFNKWLKEETSVVVEGCLNIEGEDYVIKRTLTRPQLSRRTSKSKTTQTVEYYRIVGGKEESLEEYIDNQSEENSRATNKVIKETIGNESDFDLIICATSKNLTDLIEKKDTERGKLLSRWIGLLPIEQKFELAKEKYNTTVKPSLLSNRYNSESLLQEKEAFILQNGELQKEQEKIQQEQKTLSDKIQTTQNHLYELVGAKNKIDDSLLKIDITTLDTEIQNLTEKGINKKNEIASIDNEINAINIGNFSTDAYDAMVNKKTELSSKRSSLLTEYRYISQQIDSLKKSEYCPTCGRKLDNVNHDAQISALTVNLSQIETEGKTIANEIEKLTEQITSMAESRDNFLKKSNLSIKKSACEVQIEQMRNTLKDRMQLKNDYLKNKEAIDKNNQIDLSIRNEEAILQGYKNTVDTNTQYLTNISNKITCNEKSINDIMNMLQKLQEEIVIEKNWKIYLDMIGKNGITKMVLRKALPIINAQVSYLLSDICDFNVEISINDKNEVNFLIINDGEISDISSGSGFEQTAAALALRFILAKNSVLPKLSYIVLDEIYGLVADDNLDKMHVLLDKVKSDYQSIIIVSHKDIVKSWCNTIITVSKDNHVSKLSSMAI